MNALKCIIYYKYLYLCSRLNSDSQPHIGVGSQLADDKWNIFSYKQWTMKREMCNITEMTKPNSNPLNHCHSSFVVYRNCVTIEFDECVRM